MRGVSAGQLAGMLHLIRAPTYRLGVGARAARIDGGAVAVRERLVS